MFDWKSREEWKRLFRYYQTGLINTAVGPGIFMFFIYVGMNVYVGQLLSHLIGMAFNYFSYSRYAFAGMTSSKVNFVLAYTVNYILSVAALAAFSHLGFSPYLAGLFATGVVSLANFFVLKRYVFTAPASQP